MNTFSGLKNGNEKFYPYLSTSHYMRSAMGTEKPGKYEDPTGTSIKLQCDQFIRENNVKGSILLVRLLHTYPLYRWSHSDFHVDRKSVHIV